MKDVFSKSIALLKENFLAGIFVVVPFLAIAWILGAFVGLIWHLQALLPASWMPPEQAFFLKILITLATALLLSLGISILGWSSKHYFGRKALELASEIISRIPVIRSVYSALDQLLKTIGAGGGQQFSRVVYVEYPRKGMWTLAFVTGTIRTAAFPDKHLSIYVPTTPNPTSGFYLIVPETDVRESHLRVEDAFKSILSLGIAQSNPETSKKPVKAEEGTS